MLPSIFSNLCERQQVATMQPPHSSAWTMSPDEHMHLQEVCTPPETSKRQHPCLAGVYKIVDRHCFLLRPLFAFLSFSFSHFFSFFSSLDPAGSFSSNRRPQCTCSCKPKLTHSGLQSYKEEYIPMYVPCDSHTQRSRCAKLYVQDASWVDDKLGAQSLHAHILLYM